MPPPSAHQRTYFLNDPLSLYPIKYLGETFLPYDSLFSFVYIKRFFIFIKITLVDLMSSKFTFFPLIRILGGKSGKIFL